MEYTKTSDVYLAFNNSIAKECKSKIKNAKTKVYTFHSLGYSIMNYNIAKVEKKEKMFKFDSELIYKGIVDANKAYKILDEILKEETNEDLRYKAFLKENYANLYQLCRVMLLNMSDIYILKKTIKDYNLFVDYSEEEYEVPNIEKIKSTINILDKKSKKIFEEEKIIDFSDMLYITILKLKKEEWEIPYWLYFTNIYCDECQDYNNLQLQLLKFIKREKGRYIFAGDYYQSIYSFNGANSQSFNLIPSLFAPIKKLKLPICYRCPTSHLEKVNREFNIPIIPREGAPKGEIKNIKKNEIRKYIKIGDMVISRKNKWLSDVIMNLVSVGVPVFIEDKEFVSKIKKFTEKAEEDTLREYEENLNKQKERIEKTIRENLTKEKVEKMIEENSKLIKENYPSYLLEESEDKNVITYETVVQNILDNNTKIDNIDFLLKIIEGYKKKSNKKDLKSFLDYFNTLLNTKIPQNCVRISTVHKAKGLEADNVFVLNEGKVVKDFRNSLEQQFQEKNLSYISITRSKHNLYLVKESENAKK